MVSERRKECGLPKQVLFNVEENRPLFKVVAIRNKISCVHDEIGNAVFYYFRNNSPVHVMTSSSVAIHYKPVRHGASRSRFEIPFAAFPG